ncbi:MAG: PaaI family thioesterase [Deltaproteobacteria bacterium]|nr:PaaI family thioesterase [Deltaproteobacteria bacterium]
MDTEKEYLPHSTGCFLCGEGNACGVRTRFFVEGDAVRARLALPRHVNGYRNVAHGGVLAALLDESIGWAATVFGRKHPMYLTGELTVKFLAPVPVGEEIEIASRLVRDAGRIAFGEGELSCGGKVCVRATGKFFPMSREETRAVIPYLKFGNCRKYRALFEESAED